MIIGLLDNVWSPPSPAVVLAALIGVSVAVALVDGLARRNRRRALRRLAASWGMTYSACDNLRVSHKISHRLPITGAADVFVTDVIYGGAGDAYRYVFTAEYTLGAVRGKRRQVRVGAFAESRHKDGTAPAGDVVLAPEGIPLLEQYEKMTPS
ncbi:MAG TPA: hypothetical protein VLJ39_09170 [Tepidisphaeraceae bacterium]|nr:hypothetical protein [Tepidisphaeraceae bacterium]